MTSEGMFTADQKPGIIMVDDQENVLRTMGSVFRRKGYRVEGCLSAKEALAAAREKDFAVALLDINMPDMNGRELVAPMRELRPEMDVLFVTADREPGYSVADARKLGVAGYVVKPVDMDNMLERVDTLIREQHRKRRAKELSREAEEKKALAAEAQAELEKMVKERTRRLEKDLLESRKANEDKVHMVAAIAHEMLNSVNVIMGMGKVSAGYDHQLTREQAQRFMKLIVGSGNRIERFVEEMRVFAQLQVGENPYKMKDADVGAVIREVLDNDFAFVPEILEKEIPFKNRMKGVMISCDDKYVAHAVRNLIGNAVKHSPNKNWEVKVALEPMVEDVWGYKEELAVISVSDRGKGVPDKEKENIFKRYVQGRMTDTSLRKGTGLGLSIAREIVEAHGGTIWCEDNTGGKGSVFRFTLPLNPLWK